MHDQRQPGHRFRPPEAGRPAGGPARTARSPVAAEPTDAPGLPGRLRGHPQAETTGRRSLRPVCRAVGSPAAAGRRARRHPGTGGTLPLSAGRTRPGGTVPGGRRGTGKGAVRPRARGAADPGRVRRLRSALRRGRRAGRRTGPGHPLAGGSRAYRSRARRGPRGGPERTVSPGRLRRFPAAVPRPRRVRPGAPGRGAGPPGPPRASQTQVRRHDRGGPGPPRPYRRGTGRGGHGRRAAGPVARGGTGGPRGVDRTCEGPVGPA